MKRGYLISPYRGTEHRSIKDHLTYARRCAHWMMQSGYSPYASHVFLAASDWLNDDDAKDRDFGFECGKAFLETCEVAFVFLDYGVSSGMRRDIDTTMRIIEAPLRGETLKLRYARLLSAPPTGNELHALSLPHAHLPCAQCQIAQQAAGEPGKEKGTST